MAAGPPSLEQQDAERRMRNAMHEAAAAHTSASVAMCHESEAASALSALLAALPTCSHYGDDGRGCGAPATHSQYESSYACDRHVCEDGCPERLPWADAAARARRVVG